MSDQDECGAAQNVQPHHPSRNLFHVGNPFWPPASYHTLPSYDSSSEASRRRDSQQSLRGDSFVVDINLPPRQSDSRSSSSSSVCSSSSRSARITESAHLLKSSSSDSWNISVLSYRKTRDSSNNSSPYRKIQTSSEDIASTRETSSGENEGGNRDSRSPSLDTVDGDDDSDHEDDDDDESESAPASSSGEETESDSKFLETSSDELFNYAQYACRDNRNINAWNSQNRNVNARKGGKSKSEPSSDKEPLVDKKKGDKSGRPKTKKGESGDKDSSGESKDQQSSQSDSASSKDDSDSKDHSKGRGGSKERKARHGSKKGSKSRKGSKKKDTKRKGSKGSKTGPKKKKGKKDEKDKDQFSNFFKNFYEYSPYPPGIFYILGSEFCERFTYYGLRTILVMYLTGWLGAGPNEATSIFHMFNCLAYVTPIMGASIADGCLGKYKTILFVSAVYAIGCIVLAATSVPPPELAGPLAGLFLISIGTGGIKPCIVAFGGDQIPREQVRRRATFFSTFYFMINIGSVLSTFITPILRSNVHCINDSCYPLAFGVPAGLMTLAFIIFAAGRNSYVYEDHTESNFVEAIKYICVSEEGKEEDKNDKKDKKNKLSKGKKDKKSKNKNNNKKDKNKKEKDTKSGKKSTLSSKKHKKSMTEDAKMVTRLLWLFIPIPIFWALFNQQGSRWTLQAAQLDGTIGMIGRLKPDQMQALNPLFIILLIPMFERVIYPCVNSCGFSNKALYRMVAGMVFCSLAFVLAAVLQMKIDDATEKPLEGGEAGYLIINTLDCKINVHGDPSPFFEGYIAPFGQTEFKKVLPGVKDVQIDDKRNKSMNGTGYVSFLHLLAWVDVAKIRVASTRYPTESVVMQISLQNATFFHVFEPGGYQVSVPSITNGTPSQKDVGGWQNVGKPFEVGSGGIYTVALIDPNVAIDLGDVMVETYEDVKGNSLSMILMIPQYIILTTGEVLFSISGLAFAYSQTPESMKSVVQTCWLLTSACGDLIVILITECGLVPSQMVEFAVYAALMLADALVLGIMSCFYTVIDPAKYGKKKEKSGNKKNKSKGKKDHKKDKSKKGSLLSRKGSKSSEKDDKKERERRGSDSGEEGRGPHGSKSDKEGRGKRGSKSDKEGRSGRDKEGDERRRRKRKNRPSGQGGDEEKKHPDKKLDEPRDKEKRRHGGKPGGKARKKRAGKKHREKH